MSADTQSFRRERWLLYAAAIAVALIPVAPLLLNAHPLQTFDYYLLIAETFGRSGPEGIRWSSLLIYNNENFVALPRLVYIANLWLTDGSNVPLVWLSAAFALGLSALLWRAMPTAVHSNVFVSAGTALAAGYLCFAAAGVENLIRGFAGVMFLGSMLLASLSVHAYTRDRLVAALFLATVASATYTIGLFVWLALCVAAFGLRRGRREILLLIGLTAAVFGVYLFTYGRPPAHPELVWNPIDVAITTGVAAGAVWSKDVTVAAPVGLAGIAAALILGWRALRRGEAGVVFWAAVAALALIALGAIGFSRAGFGYGAGFTSRYASLSGLLWISLLGLALNASPARLIARRAVGGAVLVAIAAGFLTAWQANLPVLERYDRISRIGPLGALLLHLDPDPYARRNTFGMGGWNIFNGLDYRATPALRRAGQYPFNAGYRMACRDLGERIETRQITGRLDPGAGALAAAWPQEGGTLLWRGWIDPRLGADCLLLVGPDNRVTGAAWARFQDPVAAHRLGLPVHARTAFLGLTGDSQPPEQVRLLVRVPGREGFLTVHRADLSACARAAPEDLREAAQADGADGIRGAIDGVRPADGGAKFAVGWVDGTDSTLRCVLVVDSDDTPVARAVIGFERPDLRRIFGPDFALMGWRARLPADADNGPYRAFAIDAEGRAWRLP